MGSRWIETIAHTGPTVKQDGFTVTPESWSLTVAWPRGGWVWNHPRGILVDRDGNQERIPIYNLTRIGQLALVALAVVGTLLYVAPRGGKPKDRRKQND